MEGNNLRAIVNILIKNKILQKILIISTVLTMSVAYPFLFHLFGVNGKMFLPIFLFVLLGSNYLDFKTIFLIAISVPILNYLFTGMPILSPLPIMQMLTIELGMLVIFLQIFKKINLFNYTRNMISFILARMTPLVLIIFYDNFTFSFWLKNFKIGLVGIILNLLIAEITLKIFSHEKN